MEFFDALFKRNKDDKNELVEQNNEVANEVHMPNFEVLATAEQEVQALKRILEPSVKKAVKEIVRKGIEPEKIYKAVIPPEMVEGMKDGKLQFMKSLNGSLLPNIVDENNQIVKKVRLEEMELFTQDLNAVNQLSDKILNHKLDALSDQMDVIIDLAREINQQLKHKTYAKVISAVETINQSNLDEKRNTRQQLQNHAQVLLNEAIATLRLEIEINLQYFSDWEKRTPFFNTYTTKTLERRFNQLMEDYLFFNNAKSSLVKLKRSQGISIEQLRSMTNDLREIDLQFKDIGIRSWLPPQTNENRWQHDLVGQMEMNNARLVIEYKVDEFLEEGSELENGEM
ncbi:hypothetical protein [Ruoffia tabacinasalis]|uniref:Uncharacterized protein n=1 Tax=Ruoffia tabacinasalis TaxID=87458 RepID=A0ABS0LKQ7_9LACT|nr:hypothetical protein [Ruoffia tabacinasalis]MBG9978876.1 hypothetical protein [Ruoffia tabacinasalis]